jgi:hypothetical protein
LGTVTQATDSFYEFTATGSLTLPKYPENGAIYTIKNKSSATVTINANTTGVSQTIGTTTSTAFLLYAQEDYVTLRYSLSDTTWYVVATNGSIVASNQTASTSCSTLNAWTAIGNGFSLGTLQPGVYDIDLDLSIGGNTNAVINIGIGNGTALISVPNGGNSAMSTQYFAMHSQVRNYILSSAAVIQGIYYSTYLGGSTSYVVPYNIGRITARRVG